MPTMRYLGAAPEPLISKLGYGGGTSSIGFPPAPTFGVNLINNLIPYAAGGSSTPTFNRATVAAFMDWESVLRTAISGEARFQGARRCQNTLQASETLDGALWQVTGTASITPGATDPLGGTSAYTLNLPAAGDAFRALNAWTSATGKSIRMSLWIKADSAGTIRLSEGNAGVPSNELSVTTSWQRMTTDAGLCSTNALFYLDRNGAGQLSKVYIWRPQLEDVTGASVTAPSEYVSVGVLSAPYHGAGVDGVKYFTTQNGNSVASNVVTEATGAQIPTTTLLGYLAEAAGTQLVTPTAAIRDFTGTWALTSMTAAKTSTGVDGAASSASRLTATGATATALITLAGATSRTVSAYIRRVTGTGTIKLTQGASKSADLSSSLNSSTYTLVQFNASADTSVTGYGIEIGTSGDAIDVDFYQFESGTFATSRMAAAGAARNQDILSYPNTGNVADAAGTVYAEYMLTSWANMASDSRVIANKTSAATALALFPRSKTVPSGCWDSTTVLSGPTTAAKTGVVKGATKWSGATMNTYADGVAGAGAAYDGSWGWTLISIGADSTSPFVGTIRNVRIWTQALTAQQIAGLG